jgi:hypothetical protein
MSFRRTFILFISVRAYGDTLSFDDILFQKCPNYNAYDSNFNQCLLEQTQGNTKFY